MIDLPKGLFLNRNTWRFLERTNDYVRAFDQANEGDRRLLPEPARRQLLTASAILDRLRSQRGVLLADDVGLGKTAVAILVACVVAGSDCLSDRKRVRILAPNALLRRKWQAELLAHMLALRIAAPHLDLHLAERSVRRGRIGKLKAGQIEVTTHLSDGTLDCDLLIIDEAHRARNAGSQFAGRLRRAAKNVGGVLTLTATPFSVQVSEFSNLLRHVGAGREVVTAAKRFSTRLDALWDGRFGTDSKSFGDRLAEDGEAAVAALRPFVMRLGVDDLTAVEQTSFGKQEEWEINVPNVSADEARLLATAVRILQLGKRTDAWGRSRMNDPRFHTGWAHLQVVLASVRAVLPADDASADTRAIGLHLRSAKVLLDHAVKAGHAKMRAVAVAVREIVRGGEKVLLFCQHHATAAELTIALSDELGSPALAPSADWESAWRTCLGGQLQSDVSADLVEPYVRWLCSPTVTSQVARWLGDVPGDAKKLSIKLGDHRPRPHAGHRDQSIATAAVHLFSMLEASKSSREVLKSGSENHTTDAILAVFNSPFGPDVLVATDALSEGVDLHGCCRHLVHYELNPSPLSAIQRNGRLRRIDCWAARCNQPLRIAWPRFTGTRDERLVRIVQQRLKQFGLLLGGIAAPADPDAPDDAERERAVAFGRAKERLAKLSLSPL
jgi:ERCC4-related helicase